MKHKPISPAEKAWLDCLAVELNRSPCAVPWFAADVYVMLSRNLMAAGCSPMEAATTIRALNDEVETTVRQHVSSLANNPSFN